MRKKERGKSIDFVGKINWKGRKKYVTAKLVARVTLTTWFSNGLRDFLCNFRDFLCNFRDFLRNLREFPLNFPEIGELAAKFRFHEVEIIRKGDRKEKQKKDRKLV